VQLRHLVLLHHRRPRQTHGTGYQLAKKSLEQTIFAVKLETILNNAGGLTRSQETPAVKIITTVAMIFKRKFVAII